MPHARTSAGISGFRLAVLVGLGFGAGLPNVAATSTIGSWLSAIDVDVKAIGLFSLIAFPYTFKFLWAPLMDRFAIPLLGRRRGWLIATQGLLTITLIAMAALGPTSAESPLLPLGILGVVMVFLSASQDIVADAYRTDVLERHEWAAGAAMFVSGYRLAAILAGALVLILADRIGWRPAFASLGLFMGTTMVITAVAPEPMRVLPPQRLADAVVKPIEHFAREWGPRLAALAAFVMLFRLPDLLATPMTSPLLFKHLGFTAEQVGWIRQALGFCFTILGATAGAGVVPRWGLMRSLVLFGLLQALSNAGFLLLAALPADLWLMGSVIGFENFCNGMVAAGFVAFLTSCCDPRYSATQFALLSGLMALTGMIAGASAGYIVDQAGYGWFFGISIAAAVPGMALLIWMRLPVVPSANEPASPPSG